MIFLLRQIIKIVHGTVIGRKGLVKLGHSAPMIGLLNKVTLSLSLQGQGLFCIPQFSAKHIGANLLSFSAILLLKF
jgi:hypothetical protein